MGENSRIEWTHHTFNPWRGCTRVSPGCAHCYAEAGSGRNPAVLGVWGPHGKRVVAAESGWRKVFDWDRDAKLAGERRRVFCASLADVFEDWRGPMHDVRGAVLTARDGTFDGWRPAGADPLADGSYPLRMDDVRVRLIRTIANTPSLDWLLLTKRPENVGRFMAEACWPETGRPIFWAEDALPDNVWLGVSVEDREHGLPRVDVLRGLPAAVRFLSVEPLLEDLGPIDLTGIDWVIVGGESGHGARPMDWTWANSIKGQCVAQGVPFFFKQWGDVVSCWNDDLPDEVIRRIDASVNLAGYGGPEWFRVGKKAAGRLLDGRTWDAMPAVDEGMIA